MVVEKKVLSDQPMVVMGKPLVSPMSLVRPRGSPFSTTFAVASTACALSADQRSMALALPDATASRVAAMVDIMLSRTIW
ncbi:hypothetical protein D3C72_2497260 [compost metagenome]